jgi:hypothetical protein
MANDFVSQIKTENKEKEIRMLKAMDHFLSFTPETESNGKSIQARIDVKNELLIKYGVKLN